MSSLLKNFFLTKNALSKLFRGSLSKGLKYEVRVSQVKLQSLKLNLVD